MTREVPLVHPGIILLEDWLKPLGLTQYALAKAIGVPPRRINEIVKGQRGITADTALRLAAFFGTDADQAMSTPHKALERVCSVAGVTVTLHGLRRSFKSLTEWLEVPAGVVAQIMGHKPSATAEKHYTGRPLDLLRQHHERIEAWILEQAGVQFDAQAEPGKLRMVAG